MVYREYVGVIFPNQQVLRSSNIILFVVVPIRVLTKKPYHTQKGITIGGSRQSLFWVGGFEFPGTGGNPHVRYCLNSLKGRKGS